MLQSIQEGFSCRYRARLVTRLYLLLIGMWMLFFWGRTMKGTLSESVWAKCCFSFLLPWTQNILHCNYASGCTCKPADLESFGHDAAHDSTNSQSSLHVQFAQRRLELVNGNQPGSDCRGGCAQQIQLPVKGVKTSPVTFMSSLIWTSSSFLKKKDSLNMKRNCRTEIFLHSLQLEL